MLMDVQKNKVVEISDGATIVRIPGKEVPLMVGRLFQDRVNVLVTVCTSPGQEEGWRYWLRQY